MIEQTDLLVKTTEPFAKAVEEGNIEKAKQLYSRSRVYYERVEPVAESFGDLDPRIDARINDVDDRPSGPDSTKSKRLSGKTTVSKVKRNMPNSWLPMSRTCKQEPRSLQLKPKAMVAGAMELLEEAATSKITGEEERYSHTDLVDFQANIDGSEAVYQAAISSLNMDNKDLAGQLDKQFQAIDKLMLKYKTTDGQFVDYRKLTKPQLRELSNELNNLSKLMAQTAKIF
ncbi:imelysin family protein [Terrilactibacillus sp. S3-3]|nr:imelysin family protein [Terrilactibacillus sp. S3-3]